MEALSILDKEKWRVIPRWQYALYGEKTVCHYNDALIAKEGNTKFTFHDAEKFATELTKYLELTLKT
jgi:hypothetical protein